MNITSSQRAGRRHSRSDRIAVGLDTRSLAQCGRGSGESDGRRRHRAGFRCALGLKGVGPSVCLTTPSLTRTSVDRQIRNRCRIPRILQQLLQRSLPGGRRRQRGLGHAVVRFGRRFRQCPFRLVLGFEGSYEGGAAFLPVRHRPPALTGDAPRTTCQRQSDCHYRFNRFRSVASAYPSASQSVYRILGVRIDLRTVTVGLTRCISNAALTATKTGYEHPLAQLLAVSHRAMRARRLTLNSPSNAQQLVHTCVFTNGGVLATISRSDCVAMTDMATADPPAANPPPGPRPTRLFRNGNSQAVRIPSALAFASDRTQVEIERQGDELIIRPVKRRLSGLGSAFRDLRPYFENFRREQPPMELRDWESRKTKP